MSGPAQAAPFVALHAPPQISRTSHERLRRLHFAELTPADTALNISPRQPLARHERSLPCGRSGAETPPTPAPQRPSHKRDRAAEVLRVSIEYTTQTGNVRSSSPLRRIRFERIRSMHARLPRRARARVGHGLNPAARST